MEYENLEFNMDEVSDEELLILYFTVRKSLRVMQYEILSRDIAPQKILEVEGKYFRDGETLH